MVDDYTKQMSELQEEQADALVIQQQEQYLETQMEFQKWLAQFEKIVESKYDLFLPKDLKLTKIPPEKFDFYMVKIRQLSSLIQQFVFEKEFELSQLYYNKLQFMLGALSAHDGFERKALTTVRHELEKTRRESIIGGSSPSIFPK